MVLNGTSESYPWRNTSVVASSGQPRICLGAVTAYLQFVILVQMYGVFLMGG